MSYFTNITEKFGRMIILTGNDRDRVEAEIIDRFPAENIMDFGERFNNPNGLKFGSNAIEPELLDHKRLIIFRGDWSVNSAALMSFSGKVVDGRIGPYNVLVNCNFPLLRHWYYDNYSLWKRTLFLEPCARGGIPDNIIRTVLKTQTHVVSAEKLRSKYYGELNDLTEPETIEELMKYYKTDTERKLICAKIFKRRAKTVILRLLKGLKSATLIQVSRLTGREDIARRVLAKRHPLRFELIRWRKAVSLEAKRHGYLNRKLALRIRDQSEKPKQLIGVEQNEQCIT